MFSNGTSDYSFDALKSSTDVAAVANENSIIFIIADATDHTNRHLHLQTLIFFSYLA